MLILAIESSCDETAAAVIEDGRVVRSDVVCSQVEIHAKWGGVVPEIASRNHLLEVIPVVDQALLEANASCCFGPKIKTNMRYEHVPTH